MSTPAGFCHACLQNVLYQNLLRLSFRFKVLLTGTPIQNQLAELFALLHFLDPVKFSVDCEFPRASADLEEEGKVRQRACTVCGMCTHAFVSTGVVLLV